MPLNAESFVHLRRMSIAEPNPDLQMFLTDPLGTQGWLKPNCLHPPFNNRKAR